MSLKGKVEVYDGMSVIEAFAIGEKLDTDYLIVVTGQITPNVLGNNSEVFHNNSEVFHKRVDPFFCNHIDNKDDSEDKIEAFCELNILIKMINGGYDSEARITMHDAKGNARRKYANTFSLIDDDAIMFELWKNHHKKRDYEKVYLCSNGNIQYDNVSKHYKCKITRVILYK